MASDFFCKLVTVLQLPPYFFSTAVASRLLRVDLGSWGYTHMSIDTPFVMSRMGTPFLVKQADSAHVRCSFVFAASSYLGQSWTGRGVMAVMAT